MYLQHPIAQHF